MVLATGDIGRADYGMLANTPAALDVAVVLAEDANDPTNNDHLANVGAKSRPEIIPLATRRGINLRASHYDNPMPNHIKISSG